MSIVIKNINKYYGAQKALDNISFSIEKGELMGFLGPNGAGKSTMMKIITGYLQANSGKVYVNDELVEIGNTPVRRQIGYLPEHNPLYTELYVKESLELTAGLYKLENKKDKVSEIIGLTGLGDEQHKKNQCPLKGLQAKGWVGTSFDP